jgi:5-hydroxyisourate hydrolase
MSAITTHVLDTTRGQPAAGVSIVLERRSGSAQWEHVARGETDSDGRLRSLLADDAPLVAGVYRLVFATGRYFDQQGARALFPEVVIVFEALPGQRYYHLPLLLSPFGYSTYRGS